MTTRASGDYSVPYLLSGTDTIKADHQGFRASVMGGVVLRRPSKQVGGGTERELTIPASKAYAKSMERFWHFGKRAATDAALNEPIGRE